MHDNVPSVITDAMGSSATPADRCRMSSLACGSEMLKKCGNEVMIRSRPNQYCSFDTASPISPERLEKVLENDKNILEQIV